MTQTAIRPAILNNQKGFTLIELIMVIVILGILAAVALPKYADMQTEAAVAQAEGVLGAAEGAAAINYAAGLVGATQPAGAAITTGTLLLDALDGTPNGWAKNTADDGIEATINTVTYEIIIDTGEVAATNKAVLNPSWR